MGDDETSDREAFFQAVMRDSPDIAFVVGPDRHYKFVSSGIEKILGWTEADLRDMRALELSHPDDVPAVAELFRALMSDSIGSARITYRARHKNGSWRTLDVVARNELANPVVRGIVVNGRDVTSQRRVDEQEQQTRRLESLGRLAGGVAHDFNNLLTVVLSTVELLRRDLNAGRAAKLEDVDAIADAAWRAAGLTKQLLSFARKQPHARGPFDVAQAVRAAAKTLGPLLGEDITLVLDLPSQPWLVLSEQTLIDQVLLNLSANARDAMPAGGTLTISVSNTEVRSDGDGLPGVSPGQWVRLRVSDTGAGIDAAVQERVFEPFFSTKPTGKGVGLGLSMVHGIVTQSGGHIGIESAPGQGATIDMWFPRTQLVPGVTTAVPVAAPLRGYESILVAEDEDAVRRVVAATLTGAGYQVLIATDGAHALEVAATRPVIDLLLTDVMMPRVDGRRLAEQLLAERPGLKVLFISGHTDDRLEPGGPISRPDLLEKPFTPDTLLERVRAALDRR